MTEQERRLSVRLPVELHRAVRLKSVQVDKPVSVIVRELLQRWIEEDPPTQEEASQEDK